jgi:hypothetical protein
MKLAISVALAAFSPFALAFRPAVIRSGRRSVATTTLYGTPGLDLSGNAWKPDSEKMGSTDTGDYFPDDYDPNDQAIGYTDGMYGSQAMLMGKNQGPQLPGMENLGADAIVTGGIETASEIPAGMEFIPSSVPDGVFEMTVPSNGSAQALEIQVPPICMGFEDYYASFSKDSHPCFSVKPATGRMNRRGGEPTDMTIMCNPNGQAGDFRGNLVINLPEDNSKICYQVIAKCF